MLVEHPKYRRPVSNNQLQLLGLLYKFRYVTTDLIAVVLKKDRSTIYESLYVLQKQGYIHKFHDKTYRLRGRPAIYCLASGGIKYLRDNTSLNKPTLRNFYKNKTMREEHIDRCLLIFTLFNTLKQQSGKKFAIYTKYELIREAFPKPLPELFLKAKTKDGSNYTLDIFEAGTMSWLLRKRISQYQEAADESEHQYPNALFISQNVSTERRLFRYTYENYADLNFYLTREDLLLNSQDGKVWIDMAETYDENEIERVGV